MAMIKSKSQPPSEIKLTKPLKPVLTRVPDEEPSDSLDRTPHRVNITQNQDGNYHMKTALEEEDLENSIELNSFEYEMFTQYKEACSTFNMFCVGKLARGNSLIYNLMSRIYDVFEKYGIDSGHRDEFIIEFTRDDLHVRPRHVRVGSGKLRGIFYFSGWTLRFDLSEKSPYSAIGKRIKLVNGELSTFESEFRKVVLRSRSMNNHKVSC
jgi:hypothetical protein